jgi:transposase InsO family protein
MGLERYVVDAVVLEGRRPGEIAAAHGISRSWVYALVARFREGGYEALTPRSRRPHLCPHQTGPELEAAILRLRQELGEAGHDAGAATIAHHLRLTFATVPSVATIWRVLRRRGQVTPQPHKRPRCSFVRFEASLPNEMWQADTTHWHLADGTDVEILNVLDDHSRLLIASDTFRTVKAADVVQTFYGGCERHGSPAAVLTDNGAVFTAKALKGKVLLEVELERLGIACKHSTPYHPQTCGKVERFHQTLKRFLAKQAPATSLAILQLQLDTFRAYYNQHRPHRALNGRAPLAAFAARIKASPLGTAPPTHFRVRTDKIDKVGCVTLRYDSRLYHIRVGAAHRGEPVRLLVADEHIRVIREDGSLLRELTLDPTRNYQPLGTPPGPKPRTVVQDVLTQVSAVS